MTPLRRTLKLICIGLAGVCMVTWIANGVCMARFSTQQPEPSTSHVDQWNNHGAILYRTPAQSFLLIWAWVGGVIFALIGNTIENKNWWRTLATRRGKKS